MKLARKALVIALTTLAFIGIVSAQKSEGDPRNTAPTVGTGGAVGGPTGLFTVYDGSTLQKGEYTFSAAYSNYDRDPGDVDVTEVPISFQFGVTNNLELFFNTDAFRAVKVNSPRNLSGFYLPNSNAGSSFPAIVLGAGTTGVFSNNAFFRNTNAQPFVAFPFIGGTLGIYEADPLFFPRAFGADAALGVTAGGAANNFPGIGSVFGGILPGVVLQTAILDLVPVGGLGPSESPTVFTLAPAFLPEAPLLNRNYSTSAFSTFTVGAKWRITSNSNPIGFGIIPFYRFYADNADDAAGFNQLQRGASAGSNSGDIGGILFADMRLRKWLNVSGNIGYIYNGDITSNGNTLLDRGNELLTAVAVDFPVNKHFQPVLEFRSLNYVGGRTPNAFENSPQEGLAGVRVFPARWASFSLAYRYHVNQQDRGSLDESAFNSVSNQLLLEGLSTTLLTTSINNFTGAPPGFRTSSDPHGFLVQATVGRRNSRGSPSVINVPATVVSVTLSKETITLGCESGSKSTSGGCDDDDRTINITTSATDKENDPLAYNYTVSAGRIVGTGRSVSWDLSGLGAGIYTVTVGVDDGCGVCSDTKTQTVEIKECPDCVKECACPDSISVSDAAVGVKPGENLTFTASISGGSQDSVTYNWSVNQGAIVDGEGTSTITVNTAGLSDTTVTASVVIGGLCAECPKESSGSGLVLKKIEPEYKEEFGDVPNDEVKARLDAYAADLQADPDATGYIVNYGTARQVTIRERLARTYLTDNRGIDASRLVFVNGGVEPEIRTRLWIVPAGADPSSVN